MAVGILPAEDQEAKTLERWFADDHDVRDDVDIANAVRAFIEEHAAKTVVVAEYLIGCPHEEGVDYPVGEKCPACPFWATRDRWSGTVLS